MLCSLHQESVAVKAHRMDGNSSCLRDLPSRDHLRNPWNGSSFDTCSLWMQPESLLRKIGPERGPRGKPPVLYFTPLETRARKTERPP